MYRLITGEIEMSPLHTAAPMFFIALPAPSNQLLRGLQFGNAASSLHVALSALNIFRGESRCAIEVACLRFSVDDAAPAA